MASYRFPIYTSSTSPDAATTDVYYPFAMTSFTSGLAMTTEANAQIQWYGTGTIKRIRIQLTVNTSTGNTLFRLRKNGANGNSLITIGAGATGFFEDTTNTDTWADGDLICFFLDRTAESSTVAGIGADAIADVGTVNKVGAYGSLGFATASVTRYLPFVGDIADFNTTEDNRLSPTQEIATTAENLAVYVSANARTTNTTYRLRINASNGTMNVVVGSGATGWFEDTSNTDSISAGDDVNWSFTTSTGTGTITTKSISCDLTESAGKQQCFAQSSAANVIAAATRYMPIMGQLAIGGGSVVNRMYMTGSGTARNLRVFVTTNPSSSATTFNLYKNGAATAVTTSITAGTTGEFTDLSNSVAFADGDYFLFEAIRGGGVGTVVLGYATIELDHDNEVTRRIFLIT